MIYWPSTSTSRGVTDSGAKALQRLAPLAASKRRSVGGDYAIRRATGTFVAAFVSGPQKLTKSRHDRALATTMKVGSLPTGLFVRLPNNGPL